MDKGKNTLLSIIKKLEAKKESILQESENEFMDWANSINAKQIPLTLNQSIGAWESYFHGQPPLKEPKIRGDIPDSFIAKSIEDVLKTVDSLHLVCQDGKIEEMFKTHTKIKFYSSLSDFITSELIQTTLEKIDARTDIDNIVREIQKSNDCLRYIKLVIENKADSRLSGDTIIIPNHIEDEEGIEATIIPDIGPINRLDLGKIAYYGDDILGINFEAQLTVQIDYTLNVIEYNTNPRKPFVTKINSNYFLAHDECEIFVGGIVSIPIKNSRWTRIESRVDFKGISLKEIHTVDFLSWLE